MLADLAGLAPDHRRVFAGCHYSVVMSAPWLLGWMIRNVKSAGTQTTGDEMPTSAILAA